MCKVSHLVCMLKAQWLYAFILWYITQKFNLTKFDWTKSWCLLSMIVVISIDCVFQLREHWKTFFKPQNVHSYSIEEEVSWRGSWNPPCPDDQPHSGGLLFNFFFYISFILCLEHVHKQLDFAREALFSLANLLLFHSMFDNQEDLIWRK